MDVLRDREILRKRKNNIAILEHTLWATRDQARVSEATPTDVAQAQSNVAASRSAIELAEANLKASEANCERWVGHAPQVLVKPLPISRLLPATLEKA